MQKHPGACHPHSIKTSTLRCWMQQETRETRAALPTGRGSPRGLKHAALRVTEKWGGGLCTGFLCKRFCTKSKRNCFICRHYQVIWRPLSRLLMTCYFMRSLFHVSLFSCPAGNINSFFELAINVSLKLLLYSSCLAAESVKPKLADTQNWILSAQRNKKTRTHKPQWCKRVFRCV